MKPELSSQVALRHDLADYKLKQGDVAILIDYVPHPHGGEEGCILEVFNAVGESIAVITIPLSEIESLHANEILRVRSLVS